MKEVFKELNAVNVNDRTELKGKLTYLSWAWAWAEVKKLYPNTTRKVYEGDHGVNYFTDGKTCWVKVGVTIEDLENIDYLPIMDFKNKSIPLENITSFDVNKAIQRSTTKALALHGLGLYIYAGEDLPEQPELDNEELKDLLLNGSIEELRDLLKKYNCTELQKTSITLRGKELQNGG